jgi:Tfp pilus assembly protein PilX
MKIFTNNKGVVALISLFFVLMLSGVGLALMSMYADEVRIVNRSWDDLRALALAEAGRARARYMLTTGAASRPWSETASPFGAGSGTYTVSAPAGSPFTITSTGYYPSNTAPRAQRVVTETDVVGGGGGGTNLSTVVGVVATASSVQGGNAANRARDNSGITFWRSNTNGNSWIRLDYGSAKTVSSVTLTNGAGLAVAVVQYSTTGVFPGTPVSGTVGSFTNSGGTQSFTQFTARYIFISIPTGNRPQIYEFQTFGPGTLTKGTFGTSG